MCILHINCLSFSFKHWITQMLPARVKCITNKNRQMKHATPLSSSNLLCMSGEFLSATLSRKRRGFAHRTASRKSVQALGRVPWCLLLLCSSAIIHSQGATCNLFYLLYQHIPSPGTRDYCSAFHCHFPFLKQNLKGSNILYQIVFCLFFYTEYFLKPKLSDRMQHIGGTLLL